MEKEQLQERKEHILECMKSPAYVPMKRKDMRVLLGVPEEDRTYFEQIIAELIDEGKIFETKRGKLCRKHCRWQREYSSAMQKALAL